MNEIGPRLRSAREARGLALEEVSAKTRIPQAHLAAIEAGRFDSLPPGPYRQAWLRTYCELLDVEEPHVPPSPGEPSLIPLNVVRAVGLGTLFTALGLISWLQWGPSSRTDSRPPQPDVADQFVSIAARQNTRVEARVDGEPAHNGILTGGDSLEFSAHRRIELDVSAVEGVRIRYNGERIVPQGRQDSPRKIVFIDDGTD